MLGILKWLCSPEQWFFFSFSTFGRVSGKKKAIYLFEQFLGQSKKISLDEDLEIELLNARRRFIGHKTANASFISKE